MWHVGETFYQDVDLEDEEDDQYEEEDDDKRTKFEVKCFGTEEVCGNSLVVVIGTPATMFVNTFLHLPQQPIGEVVNSNEKNEEKPNKTKKGTCLLYQMDKTIVCQCNSHVPPEDTHNWV